MGWVKLGVDSACPPTIAMFSSWAAWFIWALMVCTMFLWAFWGSMRHVKRKAGSAPDVAMSFAFTLTASHPMRSWAPVMGSMEMMRDFSPMSMTALSMPAVGPTLISLRGVPKFLKTICLRMSMGIFPGGRVIVDTSLVFLAFELWENA